MRSFADGNGDGIGDLAGVRARLPYLAELGIDAIWFNPWYPSPMADAGYDVADYRDIDPVFGTLADAEQLIAEAHGARHQDHHRHRAQPRARTSTPGSRPRWPPAPGSPERDRFWFRPGRGPRRRPAAERLAVRSSAARPGPGSAGPDGTPGEWYLHLFAPEQPDFNWANPRSRAEFEDMLRFWFDRGADGIRIDSAALLTKDPALPEAAADEPPGPAHPYTDRDDVHEIYRSWRVLADSYPGRVLIGEVWLPDAAAAGPLPAARTSCTRCSTSLPGLPVGRRRRCAQVIDTTLGAARAGRRPGHLGAVQPRRDRHVTRYGRPDTSFDLGARDHGQPVDLELGTRRARAAALLTMALPGAVYVYQGEELGLPRGRGHPRRPAARTRSGTGPAAPTPAGTAAGCRCRGPATRRRSASARRGRAAVAAAAGRLGAR